MRTISVLSLAAGVGWRAWRLSTKRFTTEKERTAAADALWRSEGARLRRKAIRLGGLLIKLGQFLSARADVLPEAFTSELGSLQDVVPPVPWRLVHKSLRRAYGNSFPTIFETFEHTPIAAASLAQVYRAKTGDRRVAVKVLRPGIEGIVATDLSAVRIAAVWATRLTSWGKRFDLVAVWEDLASITLEELDLKGEAERAQRFKDNFKDEPEIGAPEILLPLVRTRVLVMEEVSGIKPDDVDSLKASGIDQRELAKLLVKSYMKQWLVDGFFHADPHPGNIFVQPNGSVVYVDFGMMGVVQPEDRAALQKLVSGVIVQDMDSAVSALEDLGFLRPASDRSRLRRTVGALVSRLMSAGPPMPTGWEASPEAEALARDIRYFLHDNTLQLPVRYAFLGRALGILAGLVARLTPEEPFVRMMASGAQRYIRVEGQDVQNSMRSVLRRLSQVPGKLLQLLEDAESGSLRVRVENTDLIEELKADRRSRRALVLMMMAGFSTFLAAFGHLGVPGAPAAWVLGAVFAILALTGRS